MRQRLVRAGVRKGLGWAALVVVLSLLSISRAQATTWDRIARQLRLLERVGVEALVARDCPEGLLGAFHEGKRALLMCGNNLPDDPSYVWVVLAHESAHVMQFCKGGELMPTALLKRGMNEARLHRPEVFHELQLYHSSQHHVEAEARLVQALPPNQVEALFRKHCAHQLGR